MLFESMIFNLLPAAIGIMAVVLVFESCWRKCPPDKLMIVSGAGKMRSVSGKGTFVIPLLQRVDTLSLGAVQVQLTTENDIPTQDAILIHACAVANFQIGQTPELIETASKNYLNLDKEEMTRQVTEGIQARAKAEAEATRLKGESEGVAEKAHGEGVAAGIKAQAEAYNGMDNPYLLANRYIDIMPKVAEQVAKPLTAVDSIKMYGSGNAQKLVKETTSIVDQVASGLKDSTGIDLPSLLNGLISNPDIDADSAENSVE